MKLTGYLSHVDNRINGKALRKPDLNLIAKLDEMGVELANVNIAVNPVTGYVAHTDLFIATLVNWTFMVYATYDPVAMTPMTFRGKKVNLQTWDRVRHLILSLDKEVYYNFID